MVNRRETRECVNGALRKLHGSATEVLIVVVNGRGLISCATVTVSYLFVLTH